MEADIKDHFPDSTVELIEGSEGVFEVKHDGELIFSKKKLGRFPEHEEIFEALRAEG